MLRVGNREEAEMPGCKLKPRRQRSNNERKWPRWLRNPRLLKWAFRVGELTYRLWRLWYFFIGPSDG